MDNNHHSIMNHPSLGNWIAGGTLFLNSVGNWILHTEIQDVASFLSIVVLLIVNIRKVLYELTRLGQSCLLLFRKIKGGKR